MSDWTSHGFFQGSPGISSTGQSFLVKVLNIIVIPVSYVLFLASYTFCISWCLSFSNRTVLGVKISHGHDCTSCATLGHFEVEFWCETCRYDTLVQHSVQGFIVRAAHFGARMLKVRPTGEGGMPKRLKNWLFQGANVDEMDWNFHRTIPAPWPIIFTEFHSPGSPSAMRYHAKHDRLGQRLLGSVKGWRKRYRVRESDYSTSKQNASPTVGKCRPHHLESNQVCLLSLLLRTIWTSFSCSCWQWSGQWPLNLVCLIRSKRRQTRSWQSSCSERRQSRSLSAGARCVVMPMANLYAKDCILFNPDTDSFCTQVLEEEVNDSSGSKTITLVSWSFLHHFILVIPVNFIHHCPFKHDQCDH